MRFITISIIIGLIFLILISVWQAQALPQYAQKENLSCSVCHVSMTGSGPRLAEGRYYATHGYSLDGFNPADYPDPKSERSDLSLALMLKSYAASLVLLLALLSFIFMVYLKTRIIRKKRIPKILLLFHRIGGYILVVLVLALTIYCVFAYGIHFKLLRPMLHNVLGIMLLLLLGIKIYIIRRRVLFWKLCLWVGGAILTIVAANFYFTACWYFAHFNAM